MRWSLLAASALAAALSSPAHALRPASDSAPAMPIVVAQNDRHGESSMAQDPMEDGAMHRLGDLMVEGPWARATPRGARVGGAFLTIRNVGQRGDRLIAVESEIAARVQLHQSLVEDGVMKMRRVVGGIEVPAGGMAELKPGSFHVMLMGLTAPLEEGGSFPVTLTFERAGSVTVDVRVRAAGAMDAGMPHGN